MSIQTKSDLKVYFYHSIAFKIIMMILGFMIVIALFTRFIVQHSARPQMVQAMDDFVKEKGVSSISKISEDMEYVNATVINFSNILNTTDLNESALATLSTAYWTGVDKRIVNGGTQFEPYVFNKTQARKTFDFYRDDQHKMVANNEYEDPNLVPVDYFSQGYYLPAIFSKQPNCIWIPASIEPLTQSTTITCAKAFTRNGVVAGITNVDLETDQRLKELATQIEAQTGGYVFLLDTDNRFLTYPNLNDVTIPTDRYGRVRMTATQFAEKNPQFAPIALAVKQMNEKFIQKAYQTDTHSLNLIQQQINSRLAPNEYDPEQIQLMSANIVLQTHPSKTTQISPFRLKIDLKADPLHQQQASAYIFEQPETNWKMIIVKPETEVNAYADNITRTLNSALLLLISLAGLGLLGMAYIGVIRPLRKTSASVRDLAKLVQESRFLDMNKLKLNVNGHDEVSMVGKSVNTLVDRVVRTEGRLANINEELEQTVQERTQELRKVLAELKASQTQIIFSEKMAMLGQMVAGVAHEVNTPLGYVKNNILMTQDKMTNFKLLLEKSQHIQQLLTDNTTLDQHEIKEALDTLGILSTKLSKDKVANNLHVILEDAIFGVEQISDLVVNLKSFARLDESKIKAVDLHDCIESSLKIAHNITKNRVEIIKEFGNIPLVSCSPSQINQVILNLITNATQAVAPDQHGLIHIHTYADQQYVYLQIKDNGSGMSDDVMSKIFEPFFTTKPAGEGTGLGLAICAQIIEQHQGTIQVMSEPHKGTVFTLSLPLNK